MQQAIQREVMFQQSEPNPDRTKETRNKILRATVSTIEDLGYHQTTIQRIAREAGVSVGAIRHHFLSKEELFACVLRNTFRQLSFDIGKLNLVAGPTATRIDSFIDGCWHLCNSPEYLAILQILFGMRNDVNNFNEWISRAVGHFQQNSKESWDAIFNPDGNAQLDSYELVHLIFSALSGIAVLGRINGNSDQQMLDIKIFKALVLSRYS